MTACIICVCSEAATSPVGAASATLTYCLRLGAEAVRETLCLAHRWAHDEVSRDTSNSLERALESAVRGQS